MPRPRRSSVPVCHPDRSYGALGLCDPCYQRDYRSKNRARIAVLERNKHFRTNYGISAEQRDTILADQGNKCALCFELLARTGPRTHLDHDHVSGIVRGVLCNRCNWYMAKVDADPALLGRLREYKERPRAN